MFVVADHRRFYPKMIQQLLRLARVFAGDEVTFFEHTDRTQRDVLEIADWRSDQVEPRREVLFLRHTRSLASMWLGHSCPS